MQSLTKNASHEGFEALWKPEFYPPLHNLHQIIFLGRTRDKNPRGRAIRLTSCRLAAQIILRMDILRAPDVSLVQGPFAPL